MKALVLFVLLSANAVAQSDSIALVLAPRIEKLAVVDWGFDDSTGSWSGARAFIPFDVQKPKDSCSKCLHIPDGVVFYARRAWGESENPLEIEVYFNDMYYRDNLVFVFNQNDGYLSRSAWDTLVKARWQTSQRVWARRAEAQAVKDNETRRLQNQVLRRFR